MSQQTESNVLKPIRSTFRIVLPINKVLITTKHIAIGSVLPISLIIIWEFLSRLGVLPPNLLPAPTIVLQKIYSMIVDGSLWGHIGITFFRVLVGFIIGTVVAVLFGSIVGFFRLAEQIIDPLLQAFRSIPSLAWVPLFILWLSIGETSKITLIAVGVFFPVYLNIVSGVKGVDRKLIEVGKIYGFSTFQLIRKIILPASLPSFLVGIRSGLGLGWMFVVAAELMGASQGLGFLLVFGQNMSSPDMILASILLFALLGKLSDWILKTIETKALHWQDSLSGSEGR
ncbi:ABC transporter permease [Bacillus sp. DJP31]|uniref:ABC transporter permease n=1 Tax=Bacillus sp. DJP31 TaxID=3409789 RepID=UPI003BB5FBF2